MTCWIGAPVQVTASLVVKRSCQVVTPMEGGPKRFVVTPMEGGQNVLL